MKTLITSTVTVSKEHADVLSIGQEIRVTLSTASPHVVYNGTILEMHQLASGAVDVTIEPTRVTNATK